jgi:soluble P-type ATPase
MKKRIAAVRNGGNDVRIIIEVDVGIFIIGKEGMQAALKHEFELYKF